MGVHSKAVKSTSRLCPTCTSGTSHRDRLSQSPLSTQSPLSILAKSDSPSLIPQVPTHQAPNPRYQPGFRAVPPPNHQPNPHSVCKTPLHVDFAHNNHARAPRAYINTVTPRTAATPHPLLFSPRMRVCCTFFHPLTRGNPGGWGFLRLPVCLASLVRTLFEVSFYRHRQVAGLAAIPRPTYELPTNYVSSYTMMGRAGYNLSVDKVGFFAEKAVADKEKAVGIFSMAFIWWIGLTSNRRRPRSRGPRRPLRKQRPAKRRGQT
jgi:hypothetical protein